MMDDVSEQQEPTVDVVARAREACVEQPELTEVLERVLRLDEVELARRPAELDAVHRVLRETLANAGRPGPGA